jgi:hypothetical protein
VTHRTIAHIKSLRQPCASSILLAMDPYTLSKSRWRYRKENRHRNAGSGCHCSCCSHPGPARSTTKNALARDLKAEYRIRNGPGRVVAGRRGVVAASEFVRLFWTDIRDYDDEEVNRGAPFCAGLVGCREDDICEGLFCMGRDVTVQTERKVLVDSMVERSRVDEDDWDLVSNHSSEFSILEDITEWEEVTVV